MTYDALELMHGSGNVFRDFGHPNAEAEQLKAILAAKIIGLLDDQKIIVRRAQEITGFAAADFSRVRLAKLSRFTIDRMMSMLTRLGQQVEISIDVRPRRQRVVRQTPGATKASQTKAKRSTTANNRKRGAL